MMLTHGILSTLPIVHARGRIGLTFVLLRYNDLVWKMHRITVTGGLENCIGT